MATSEMAPNPNIAVEDDLIICFKGFLESLREVGMLRWNPADMEREQRDVAKAIVRWAQKGAEFMIDRLAMATVVDWKTGERLPIPPEVWRLVGKNFCTRKFLREPV